ncbi:recombinase family protein [Alteromonas marina]|nr:resolvase [Alteromonas sp. Mex14]
MAHIGFARVSTKDQDLSAQLELLSNAGCEEIFHGKQSGASDENDRKLEELIRYVRKGDIVVVVKLDRLGRSLRSILTTIDSIHAKKATLRSLDGAIDTSNESPFSRAQIALLGTFAQLERDLIVSRTSEGRERAMGAGVQFGAPKKVDDQQREKIRKAYFKGKTMSELALNYGVSRQTISRIVGGKRG